MLRQTETTSMSESETPVLGQSANWTFLSNYAHVLMCLAEKPGVRLRDVAGKVGITERAVQRIVAQLEEAGVVTRTRIGRTNRYTLHREVPLRHPLESHRTVGDLLGLIGY